MKNIMNVDRNEPNTDMLSIHIDQSASFDEMSVVAKQAAAYTLKGLIPIVKKNNPKMSDEQIIEQSIEAYLTMIDSSLAEVYLDHD